MTSADPAHPAVRAADAAASAVQGEAPACRACGSIEPTSVVKFRQNVARIVFVRVSRIHGRYCQRCGDGWFRRMGLTTLAWGWWSPQSLVMAPWFLFANAAEHRRLCRETGVPCSFTSWLLRWAAVFPLAALLALLAWWLSR